MQHIRVFSTQYFLNSSIIGYVLPLYTSMTAINEDDKEQQAHMVKYWYENKILFLIGL